MLTGLFFKCSDGSRFKLKLNYDDYSPYFGVITAHNAEYGDEDNAPVSLRRFEVAGVSGWRGKYIALAKVLKDCLIYDRGIDHVQIERAFPYHERGMQRLLIAEKRIALEQKISSTHWATRARKVWKHKHAEK